MTDALASWTRRAGNIFHGRSCALPKPFGAVATPPAGKDDDGDALLQQPHRLLPDGEIVLQRFLGFGKIDRQRVGLHLVDLEQLGM